MRDLPVSVIQDAVVGCIERASFLLGDDELAALRDARDRETSDTARSVLSQLIENAEIASKDRLPLCQDTGFVVLFLDVGQEVRFTGGDLNEAIQEAIRTSYDRFFLRKSIVDHPLTRTNTTDNTPGVIHLRIVPGDRVRIRLATKGGGAENMSRIGMLPPAAGREGVVDFVVQAVRDAGGKSCPPVLVGVGLGGNFEKAALLAKEALLRPLGQPADNPVDAELERDLLERINATGVGPMGLGGSVTALAVHVLSHPSHIASLPVAVNFDCHSHRHAEVTL